MLPLRIPLGLWTAINRSVGGNGENEQRTGLARGKEYVGGGKKEEEVVDEEQPERSEQDIT